MKKLWRLRQKIDAAHRFFDSGELARPDGSFLLPSSTTKKGDLMMTNKNETNSKTPTHTVYHLIDRGTENAKWIKVGVGWEHNGGDWINLSIDSKGEKVPVTVRRRKPPIV